MSAEKFSGFCVLPKESEKLEISQFFRNFSLSYFSVIENVAFQAV